MSAYELALLGVPTSGERTALVDTLARQIAGFGLALGTDLVLHDATSVPHRDRHAAFAAAYFGGRANADLAAVDALLRASAPVIPTVSPSGDFGTEVPSQLHFANGLRRRADDPENVQLATALLEAVGLLRRQRRAFVSYRRIESRSAAIQLHDLLSERGFDVFLDTHDISPGDPVQDVLWSRLCDADVMVMLDTATYFNSKWTLQEIGRAAAKEIHVLRLVWPAHQPHRLTDLAETIYLDHAELEGPDGPIVKATADQIVLSVEKLRSRSIASRHMSITGRLRAEMAKILAEVEGIGAHRAIGLRLASGKRIWAYPVVGIPTAELLHDVSEKAVRADQIGTPYLVYDHVGIGDAWMRHLNWLDKNIATVRAIKVSEAAWAISGLEP